MGDWAPDPNWQPPDCGPQSANVLPSVDKYGFDREMQTFLPYPNFAVTAWALDWRRLNQQANEARTIISTILHGGGWSRHPAVRMWRGPEDGECRYCEGVGWTNAATGYAKCHACEGSGRVEHDVYIDSLRLYHDVMVREWIRRGYSTTRILLSRPDPRIVHPHWLGREDFHLAHRQMLMMKLPGHYREYWDDHSESPEYIWPV